MEDKRITLGRNHGASKIILSIEIYITGSG
jgi:hypothetical protein